MLRDAFVVLVSVAVGLGGVFITLMFVLFGGIAAFPPYTGQVALLIAVLFPGLLSWFMSKKWRLAIITEISFLLLAGIMYGFRR